MPSRICPVGAPAIECLLGQSGWAALAQRMLMLLMVRSWPCLDAISCLKSPCATARPQRNSRSKSVTKSGCTDHDHEVHNRPTPPTRQAAHLASVYADEAVAC